MVSWMKMRGIKRLDHSLNFEWVTVTECNVCTPVSSLSSASRGVASQTRHLLLLLCAFKRTPLSSLEFLLSLLLAFLDCIIYYMPSVCLDSGFRDWEEAILWFCWHTHIQLPLSWDSLFTLITRCCYYIRCGDYLLICQYTYAYVTRPQMLFTPSGSLCHMAKPGVRDTFTIDRWDLLDCLWHMSLLPMSWVGQGSLLNNDHCYFYPCFETSQCSSPVPCAIETGFDTRPGLCGSFCWWVMFLMVYNNRQVK